MVGCYYVVVLEKCSLEVYNVLPIWVGDVYQLENSLIQKYKPRVLSGFLVSDSLISVLEMFLLVKIEQTRYDIFVKATNADWKSVINFNTREISGMYLKFINTLNI